MAYMMLQCWSLFILQRGALCLATKHRKSFILAENVGPEEVLLEAT